MTLEALKSLLLRMPEPARAVVLVIAACLSAALVGTVLKVWFLGWDGWRDITTIGPRIARLKGYELARDDIIDARLTTSLAMEQFAFVVSPGDDRVGAQFQQTLRGFAEAAGLTVSGSQLVPDSKNESIPEAFEGLWVRLTMIGDPEALTEFLAEVYQHSPQLSVVKLSLASATKRQSQRRSGKAPSQRDEQNLEIDVHVMALTVTI